jgi:hypothetical protein
MNTIIALVIVTSAYLVSPMLVAAKIAQPWAFLILLAYGFLEWLRQETIRWSRR